MSSADELGLESTLSKLREFVKEKVRYADFNDQDKQEMIEMFVTHPVSLLRFYEAIFPMHEVP
jgi:hypothetical protein